MHASLAATLLKIVPSQHLWAHMELYRFTIV